MAQGPENAERSDGERPTRRARDRYSNRGIAITAGVVVLLIVAVAVLFGAFDGEETAVEQTDNTRMGGGITGAEVEDVVEEE